MNATDLCLAELTERFDHAFILQMSRQAPFAHYPVSPRVLNQATTGMTPQIVPPHTLPPLTFPTYAPPDQQVYNPFINERNYLQAPLDNGKQWRSRIKFELPEFKGEYRTDEVLDWLQVAKQALSSARVPHAPVKVTVSQLRDAIAT